MDGLLVKLSTRKRASQHKLWQQLSKIGTGILPISRVRVWPFRLVVIILSMILLARMVQLTVVEGSFRRQLADENRVVGVRKAASRGIFLDRSGKPLVQNIPSYKRQIVGTTLVQAKFESITRDEALAMAQQGGERVFFDVSRNYLCGRACAQLLGYVGEIDEEELAGRPNYVLGDTIGKVGLERMYETQLRGSPGSELLEVNALGQSIREIGDVQATAGKDLRLSIDTGLQQVLYEAFEGRPGAAMAIVPQTGEVLAMISSPAYDPNAVAESLEEPDMPFFNRAIGGVYPPGSVFKIVTATAGLEEGKIDAETKIEDTGEIVIDSYRYGNWLYDDLGRVEGMINIVQAMKRSNDIFFYKVGEFVGAEKVADWARMYGFESTGGLEKMGAATGLIPDPEWKERYKGERWFLGNTYHMAIGQGDVLVSPMQVARMTGAVAANGALCPLRFVTDETQGTSCMQMNLQQTTLSLIKEGMREACSEGGTASTFIGFTPRVACKTGTAENASKMELPHAWFTVYAPVDDPQIVLTVMIENAGQGSVEAAPLAKKALEYWFGRSPIDTEGNY